MARRQVPMADLAAIAALVVVTAVLLTVPGVPWPIEWILGIPFLIFYPGYAIVSAVFPTRPPEAGPGTASGVGAPGWVARLAIALGLSGVTIAVVGVVLGWTVGIRLTTAVLSIGAVTLVVLGVAAVRRRSVSPDRRAAPLAGLGSPLGSGSTGSKLQAATFVLAVVVLLGTIAYAGATPPPRETFSEFYLLSENDAGDLVAANYTTSFVAGEDQPVHVAIENHEAQVTDYEVVVLAQSVGPNGTVAGEEQLDRFTVEVPAGERNVVERQLATTRVGESVRLQFLLYKGPAPSNPDVENADLTLHLWVDVVEEA